MGFGKRAPKKEYSKNVVENSGNTEKSNSNIGSNININTDDNIVIDSLKAEKRKKASDFLKKISKKSSSNVLLFNVTKRQKLKQFINNLKILHPNMPEFWLNIEIKKFKKKFNIKDDE